MSYHPFGYNPQPQPQTQQQRDVSVNTNMNTSRVDVNVLASDDNNSAITGAIDGDEFVVTTATTLIKPGDQVRLAEQ